ncbi:MAG: chemotaxis protein CheW, partial [Chloroflexus sp.]|nr:chemotaxis protein CheW [Chloroflexus sp.]
MMSSVAQSPTTGYLTMRLASEYYALPGTSVREIMRWRTPTPVPGAPPVIPGLINQRGQIL